MGAKMRYKSLFLFCALYFQCLCLLARCSRYLAFCRAEPLPCAPVIYCFFLALVFTLPFPLSFLGLFLNTTPPPAIISSMLSPMLILFRNVSCLLMKSAEWADLVKRKIRRHGCAAKANGAGSPYLCVPYYQ